MESIPAGGIAIFPLKPGTISADAITQCMKTTKNSMSVFEISSKVDINEAFLAISSNFDRLDSFDVVILVKQEITERDYNCVQSLGITPVENLNNTHWDITGLSYGKLGNIAEYMHNRVSENETDRRTKYELKCIIIDAINAHRLDLTALREKVRIEIEEEINRRK